MCAKAFEREKRFAFFRTNGKPSLWNFQLNIQQIKKVSRKTSYLICLVQKIKGRVTEIAYHSHHLCPLLAWWSSGSGRSVLSFSTLEFNWVECQVIELKEVFSAVFVFYLGLNRIKEAKWDFRCMHVKWRTSFVILLKMAYRFAWMLQGTSSTDALSSRLKILSRPPCWGMESLSEVPMSLRKHT